MKKWISILLCLLLLVGIPLEVSAVTVVTVEVGELALPVPGENPDMTGELLYGSNAVTVESVEWIEYDPDWEWQKDMNSQDSFRDGYWYVVMVELSVIAPDSFDPELTAFINDKQATCYPPVDNNTSVTVYTSYQCSEEHRREKTVIPQVSLEVVCPVVGKTPTFALVNTDQYKSDNSSLSVTNQKNGVVWHNETTGNNLNISNAFQADCTYSVSYTLYAKQGYIFDINTTTAQINGISVPVSSDRDLGQGRTDCLTVTLKGIVPGDGKKQIEALQLDIEAPAAGAIPSYAGVEGEGYYSDNIMDGTDTATYRNGVAWCKWEGMYLTPGGIEPFQAGMEYTVKLWLFPKEGYKFSDSITAKINDRIAGIEKLEDGAIIVTATMKVPQPPQSQPVETTEPVTTQPETTQPETTEPVTTQPEATEPETTQPEATRPEATQPEAPQAEGGGWIGWTLLALALVAAGVAGVLLVRKRRK